MLEWISEADALPPIALPVLFMHPRQSAEFWSVCVAQLLVRHEGVVPQPVKPGSRWPVDFFWSRSISRHDPVLVTGNGWWSPLSHIPLPPGAQHVGHGAGSYIRQIGDVFIPQAERS